MFLSKFGTIKKKINSTLNYKTIGEFNNQKKFAISTSYKNIC